MRNKTTNIYTEWLPLIESLPNEDAGVIFKTILKYQNGDDVECNNPIWFFIKSKIDEYNDKLEVIKEKRRISGACGGLANASKRKQQIAINSKSSNKIKENKTKQNKIKEKNNIYGELNNVLLTQEQYNTLSEKYDNLNDAIEVLDTWLGTSGSKHKNKNHFAYFKSNSWVWERVTGVSNTLNKPDNMDAIIKEMKEKGVSDIIMQRTLWRLYNYSYNGYKGEE